MSLPIAEAFQLFSDPHTAELVMPPNMRFRMTNEIPDANQARNHHSVSILLLLYPDPMAATRRVGRAAQLIRLCTAAGTVRALAASRNVFNLGRQGHAGARPVRVRAAVRPLRRVRLPDFFEGEDHTTFRISLASDGSRESRRASVRRRPSQSGTHTRTAAPVSRVLFQCERWEMRIAAIAGSKTPPFLAYAS